MNDNVLGFTETLSGPIQHVRHPSGMILVPKLRTETGVKRGKFVICLPMVDSKGRIVYAVPGGGEYVE